MVDHSPLFNAVSDGNLLKIQAILNSNPELIDVRNSSHISLLMWAAYNRQAEILNYIINQKDSLDIFEAAVVGNTTKIVKLIEQKDQHVNHYSPDGFTPLGYASFFGHVEAASVLIAYGAKVNAESKNDMHVYPIHSAVANRDTDTAIEMARLLLKNNADVNVKQRGGWTPLHQAASHGSIDLVKLLIDYGADCESQSENGKTPLDMAIENRHDAVVKILKSYK